MEGICGIISFERDNHDIDRKINSMVNCLPDGESVKVDKLSGNGWALATAGWDEDSWPAIGFRFEDEQIAIVGIAEIVNLTAIAARHRLSGNKIGEVLARSFQFDPQEWAASLRGNFAFIIYNKLKKELVALVDGMGIRPLYWAKEQNTYYISSKLGAIRQAIVNPEINPVAVYAYMHNSMVPSPVTIYKNVQKFEPGLQLAADASNYRWTRYWDIQTEPKFTEDENEIAKRIYNVLEEATSELKNGTVGGREAACFLSGGTDSSSICGLLTRNAKQPIRAYSIGFPENGYDEMYYARVAAQAFNLDHREEYVQPQDLIQMLPEIVTAYDEPFGNASAIPTYFCAKTAANDGIKYLFAGDGGDEVFAGNDRYKTQMLFRNYYKIPAIIRNQIIEPALLNRFENLPVSFLQKAGRYIRKAKMPEVDRINSFRYVADSEMFSRSFLSNNNFDAVDEIQVAHYYRLRDASPIDRHLYLDMKLTIADNDLRKVNRMCDLAQVRVKYPMLDQSVVETGFRVPEHLKLKGPSGLRYIFKKAFADFLPKEILTKQKHGFGLPISQWLRNESKVSQFAYDMLFSRSHLERGYFDKEFIKKLWHLQIHDKTPYFGAIVWQMVMLEAWHLKHYEQKPVMV